jgi:hypothetical protein
MQPELAAAIRKLEHSAEGEGFSASVTPAECQILLSYINTLNEYIEGLTHGG